MHVLDGLAADGPSIAARRRGCLKTLRAGYKWDRARRRRTVVAATIVSLSLPPSLVMAQSPTPEVVPTRARLLDVALSFDGRLTGQVRNRDGEPLRRVELICQGTRGAQQRTLSDSSGCFEFRGLRGGVYFMSTAAGTRAIRLWAPGTAPPAARTALNLMADADVVRGQNPPGPLLAHCETLKCWFANPLVVSGIVAAAVAIPVAVHNANRDRDSGS